MHTDDHEFLLEDLADQCYSIESLYEDITRVYRIHLPRVMEEDGYSSTYKDEHKASFEYNLERLAILQSELKSSIDQLKRNPPLDLAKRISTALNFENKGEVHDG
jgi:hypothetical protein